jgi:hypothetical protein
VLWSEHWGGSRDLDAHLGDHRGELVAASAGVFGALLGLIITATAVILDKIDPLRLVRESRHYPQLWETLLASVRALGLACVAAIVALLVTRAGLGERVVFFAWVMLSLLSVARVARCVWIFQHVVTLAAGPPSTNGPAGR